MITAGLTRKPRQILCLGCHADDIEIGCAGAVLRLAEQYPEAEFHWVVLSAHGARRQEAERAAAALVPAGRLRGPFLHEFRDGFLPYEGAAVKAVFERLKSEVEPDLIFTHSRGDAHQDHRLVAEMTWNTFRDHLILEYEIPKYDGDMGQPQVFFALPEETCTRKVDAILDSFESQRAKRWFCAETFRALMRLRGMECNAPSGYAEAFYSRKLLW